MPSENNRTGERNVAAIERAADVLFLFASSGNGTLGVTEIAGSLEISKAVVHRILASLRDRGLVALDEESRRYSLGPAVLVLADAYLDGIDQRSIAAGAMRRLSAQTNETVTMSVLSNGMRVYVDQVTPPVEVKMTVQVGGAYPLHAGSSSKAFLAFVAPELREEVLAGDLDAVTSETITDRRALEEELGEVRRRGWAVSMGERESGAGSVAAPVFDQGDEPVMVLSVCGPVERFREKVDEVGEQLLATTTELSRQFGHRERG